MLDSSVVLVPILGGVGLVVMIIVFLRRRKSHSDPPDQGDQQRSSVIHQDAIDPPRTEPFQDSVSSKHADEVEKAREELKALNLQRQIVTSALTSIFEAEAQGRIARSSRDNLVETYKTQLKALDGQMAERKRITVFSDLLNEKEELEKNFERRMSEINERLKQFNTSPESTFSIPASENLQPEVMKTTGTQPASTGSDDGEEKKSAEKTKNKTEERIQAIREEVLKAIERLEKIESEG